MSISAQTITREIPSGTQADVKTKSRIASIDIMRGLVIIIMMMDHVREKLYLYHQVSDPMDLNTTPPELFFTRFAAHFCAPVFVFLTGLSAWLYAHPAGGFRSPSGFLFKRGLFLVFIELTVINFSWSGSYNTLWLQVIWAIGLSMIALSALVKLRYWMIGALGFLIVFGHNMLTPISFQPNEFGYTLWSILHERNFLVAEGPLKIKVTYPVLPWIGVILLGYFTGPLFSRTVDMITRRKILITMGTCCLLLLLVLRGFNIYGETLPWGYGETTVQTVMSFLNYTKYPPSLDFLLITLGVGFFLLTWFESIHNKLLDAIEVYGSVPMFIYILHLYVLLIGYRILLAIFGPNHGELFGVEHFWWVWVTTVILAVALYFPTRMFANYKHREKRNKPWLSYF